MEAWKNNLESVIEKWEKRGPPAHILENRPSGEQNSETRAKDNVLCSRNRRQPQRYDRRAKQERATEREYWASLDKNAANKQFQLITPVLKEPCPLYHMYQCQECQHLHKNYLNLETISSPSTLFNAFDINMYSCRKSMTYLIMPDAEFILSRKMYTYPKTVVTSADINRVAKEVLRKSNELLIKEEADDHTKCMLQAGICAVYSKMASNISRILIRVSSWIALKFFRKNFSSICCQTKDIRVLKEATMKKAPIIYLPLCKSSLDYVIIYFTLYYNDLRVPYTAIPDNFCKSGLLRFILRKVGGFIIPECQGGRTGEESKIILQKYLEQLLLENQSLQLPIGDESPLTGMSSTLIPIITNAVVEGVVDDVLIVPVSLCYDRKDLVSVPTTFWNIIKFLWMGLKTRFNGMVHINFGIPISLQDFCVRESRFPTRKHVKTEDPMSLDFEVYSSTSTKEVADALLDHVIADCGKFNVISCTSMLSFLLVTKHATHVFMDELETSFDWLKQEIADSNRCVGFDGLTRDVVEYALEFLASQGLVEFKVDVKDGATVKEVCAFQGLGKTELLLEYSHEVTLLFVLKAIIATSVIGITGGTLLMINGQYWDEAISRTEVLALAEHLCLLLKKEYPFVSPCTDVTSLLSDGLDSFVATGLLGIVKDSSTNEPKKMFGFEDDVDDDDYYGHYEENADINYEINLTTENKDLLLFLHSILAPYFETALFVTASLPGLINDHGLTEVELVNSLNERCMARIAEGLTFHVKWTSMKILKHIIEGLLDIGVLEKMNDSCKDSKLRITADYLEDERYLEFKQKLGICR